MDISGTRQKHLYAGQDQECSENIDDPVELEQRRAQRDKDRPEDQRTQNAVKQHPVLVFRRDGEIAENEYEYKNVIDR